MFYPSINIHTSSIVYLKHISWSLSTLKSLVNLMLFCNSNVEELSKTFEMFLACLVKLRLFRIWLMNNSGTPRFFWMIQSFLLQNSSWSPSITIFHNFLFGNPDGDGEARKRVWRKIKNPGRSQRWSVRDTMKKKTSKDYRIITQTFN